MTPSRPIRPIQRGSAALPTDLSGEAARATVLVEEYAGIEPVRARGRTDLWLGLGLALGVAVISLALAGRIWTPESAADPAVMVVAPAPVPSVAPPQELGVVPPSRGTPTPTPIQRDELIIGVSNSTTAGSTWIRVRPQEVGGKAGFAIDGHLPFDVASVTIEVRSVSGSLLASADIPAMADERPGGGGLPRIGIRSLAWALDTSAPMPADGWLVTVSWDGDSSGTSGSVTESIRATTPSTAPDDGAATRSPMRSRAAAV